VEAALPDPLHSSDGGAAEWTTVNVGEVLPGVPTPLTWTFLRDTCERGVQQAYRDLGVVGRRRPLLPGSADERSWSIFYGHVAMNVDLPRMLADNLPGTSGAAVHRQLLGGERVDDVETPSRRRYPVVLPKLAVNGALLPRRLRRDRATLHDWWHARVHAPGTPSLDVATQSLREANAYVGQAVLSHHFFCNMVSQALYESIRRLAEAAGEPGLELRLTSGQGSIEEALLLNDVWRVAHGSSTVEALLEEHGYHAPNPAELAEPSWRVDRAPLLALLSEVGRLDETHEPSAVEHRRGAEREQLERSLLGRLPRHMRPRARAVLLGCRTYLPLRQVGKTARMHAYDVGRWAARAIGDILSDRRVIDTPDDVFYLTYDEVVGSVPPDARARIASRRRTRSAYLELELPQTWRGLPEAVRKSVGVDVDEVQGIPAAAGIFTGVVRRVSTAAEIVDVQAGEVLVCHATNPSWASVLQIVGAMVVDVGGPLSHAAITAREFGVPCVINTRIGTQVLRTGDVVHVDGAAGTVRVERRAAVLTE
jgi:pyruvate,water dikinase